MRTRLLASYRGSVVPQRILAHLPVPHLFMGVSVGVIAVMVVFV